MQARQESERAGLIHANGQTPSIFIPAPVSSESTYLIAPGSVVVKAVLPQNLWPHSFFYFFVILEIVMGFLNPVTLSTTIPASTMAGIVIKKLIFMHDKYNLARMLSMIIGSFHVKEWQLYYC